jgi:hypothetical protein
VEEDEEVASVQTSDSTAFPCSASMITCNSDASETEVNSMRTVTELEFDLEPGEVTVAEFGAGTTCASVALGKFGLLGVGEDVDGKDLKPGLQIRALDLASSGPSSRLRVMSLPLPGEIGVNMNIQGRVEWLESENARLETTLDGARKRIVEQDVSVPCLRQL